MNGVHVELTVVMPCLNEAETVATCVTKAMKFLADSGVSGEVVLADNGSTDGSRQLAADAGARVVPVADKGYGNALMGGILAARGEYVIMGDADDSYDFSDLMPFVAELRKGADLVMGNRFKGGIAPGAMPPLHRYLGTPVLSFIGRLFFRSKIGDFNCGIRGFRRDSAIALGLQATGMEFASEMIVKSALANQKIVEVPTTLAKDGRSRPPHLNTWRDGWRHLRFLLLFSPTWLFLLPGLVLLVLGLGFGAAVAAGPLKIGGVSFDVDTLVACGAAVDIGFQAILFWLFTQVYAGAEGFLPEEPKVQRLLGQLSLERGLLVGAAVGLAGLVGLIFSVLYWDGYSFGHLNYEHELRLMVPSVTALVLSCQLILGTFFLSILGIKQTRHVPVGARAEIKVGDDHARQGRPEPPAAPEHLA
ncbi:MAG TPA: glycosyltransferase family 2 protein [Streptosporangiaceae bacterium]|nr:glycosyltransferase family 2 protein [Streptosporangiaceae bacterium]